MQQVSLQTSGLPLHTGPKGCVDRDGPPSLILTFAHFPSSKSTASFSAALVGSNSETTHIYTSWETICLARREHLLILELKRKLQVDTVAFLTDGP